MTRRKDPQPDAEAALADPAPDRAPDLAAEPVPEPVEATGPAMPDAVPSDPVPEPPADIPPPPPAPPPRRAGVLGPLLGGALAAVGGFALSHFDLLGVAAPDNAAELAALSTRLDGAEARQTAALGDLSTEIAALGTRLATLEAAPPPEVPDLSRLDVLDRRIDAIEALPTDGTATSAALAAKVAELDRRIAALPATDPAADIRGQLDAALARLDAAETTAKTRAAEAEAAALAARRAQALDALTAAVTEGRPFTAELQTLADAPLTTALQPFAETGVPTLATLQAEFPAAARDALTIGRDISAEDGWSDRLVDFLAAQTGARSLTPREGSTVDAILSRAEFALSQARVADTLAELELLDPAVRKPLEGWITAAGTHLSATVALQATGGE